jgi:hypothetical protein
VVHDLLAEQPRAQVELQKTATGFDVPGLTTVGALAFYIAYQCSGLSKFQQKNSS